MYTFDEEFMGDQSSLGFAHIGDRHFLTNNALIPYYKDIFFMIIFRDKFSYKEHFG